MFGSTWLVCADRVRCLLLPLCFSPLIQIFSSPGILLPPLHPSQSQKYLLRRQHLELVEAEQAIFAGTEGGEVIALSFDDEDEGSGDGGAKAVEDWLGLYFDQK